MKACALLGCLASLVMAMVSKKISAPVLGSMDSISSLDLFSLARAAAMFMSPDQPMALATLVLLMPTVVKPQAQGTRCLLSGSVLAANVAMMGASRLLRLGILDLSRGCSRPPSICGLANN